jgi:hypothetical protein
MDIFIDRAGQKRIGIVNKCEFCSIDFLTRKDHPSKFCCIKCYNDFRKNKKKANRKEIKCAWCNKNFYKILSKISESKSGLNFCNRKCKDSAQKLGGIQEIMPPHYGKAKIPNYRGMFKEVELKCFRCGYKEFSCGIDIHHIDGNRKNNNKENLLPLCAICHRALHKQLWSINISIMGVEEDSNPLPLHGRNTWSITKDAY